MKNLQLLLPFLFSLVIGSLTAQNESPLIYRINIRENIGSNSWIHLQNGLHAESLMDARAVLLHMNTYGGGVVEADSMRSAILNSPLPVYVFIDNNAASAGALIAIACDSIFMRNSATIGAATVVDGGSGAAAPDKYQSYMRGIIRATAESHGKKEILQGRDTVRVWRRDPLIAEAMVDERIVVPGYADSTQIVTLTASQALEVGYCDGIAENIHELVVAHLGMNDYRLETYNPTFYDRVRGFLTSGVVQALLIMLIIGGIYFELQSPGVGFPTAAAITAAILYFAPLYLTGYAQSWEVLLFVVGLIFIVFELFVFPGFGIPGIAGILFVFSSLVLAMVGNIRFSLEGMNPAELFRAVMIVLGGMGMGVALIIYLSSRIGKSGLLKHAALHADEEGFFSVPMEPSQLVGKTGEAATIMRPSGRVMLGGSYYDAISLQGFIEKGEAVVVKRYENFHLYVVRIKG